MNPEILRGRIIERLKQGGYYTPRDVGNSEELREKEEARVIKSIDDLEITCHEVVRS